MYNCVLSQLFFGLYQLICIFCFSYILIPKHTSPLHSLTALCVHTHRQDVLIFVGIEEAGQVFWIPSTAATFSFFFYQSLSNSMLAKWRSRWMEKVVSYHCVSLSNLSPHFPLIKLPKATAHAQIQRIKQCSSLISVSTWISCFHHCWSKPELMKTPWLLQSHLTQEWMSNVSFLVAERKPDVSGC